MARSLVALAIYACGATALAGCPYSDPCWEVETCAPEPEPEPPPDPCAGAPDTAPALDECGVFVDPSSGDDRRPGTKDAPVKTLQRAIGLAASGRGGGEAPTRRVYACRGLYEEAITLPPGVDIWGSRRCDDGGAWSYEELPVVASDPTTVIAPPTGIPLQVMGRDDTVIGGDSAPSMIFGVRAVAADASASDGKSSIAVILHAGVRATLRRSAIVAGDGKEGEAGEDMPSMRANDGEVGNAGAHACTTDFPVGALPVVTVCEDGTESISGYGGDGGIDAGGDGASGQPEPAEISERDGLGGIAAGDAPCRDGAPGKDGLDGGRGAGAVGAGYLTKDGWIGVQGEDGKRGGVGQGGGGGGGGKSRGAMTACPANRPQGGAAGGSGGSGGCGGKGGKGGGYGGASIGIIALQGSAVTLEGTPVTAGNGGNGGVGGTGQPGGVGNRGGYGGLRFASEMWDACRGGTGGNGGRGGDAGGGLGGPSYGVASIGAYVSFSPSSTATHGRSGAGGLAGNAAHRDDVGNGKAGDSAPYRQFDVPDPAPPR